MNRKLFIADDDIDDLEIFCEAVNTIDNSIECIRACNGEEALQILKKELTRPDFIFLDLNMPRINGKQCLTEIKKMDHLKNTPVIIYTTSSRKADIEETIKLGATHFLTKPTNFKDLCNVLTYVLSNNWEK